MQPAASYPLDALKKTRSAARASSEDGSLFAFGKLLREAREKARLTMPQVMLMLRHRGYRQEDGEPIDRSQLHRLETGKFKAQTRDAVLVYELAGIYGLDHADLVNALRWNRSHPSAAALPPTFGVKEVGMVIMGHEERFVRRFRALNNEQQQQVLSYFEHVADSAEKNPGAATPEAPFRKRSGR